jgi:hypothetical protein
MRLHGTQGTSCFATNCSVINECDAPESNKIVDKERTKHNILVTLSFFSYHMVHPTMHVVLLASVILRIWIPSAYLRQWMSGSLYHYFSEVSAYCAGGKY